MKLKIIQFLIICAVIITAYLAIHLQRPVERTVPVPEQIEKPAKVPEVVIPSAVPPTFDLPVDQSKPVHVGILGESRGHGLVDDQINLGILQQLFETLKVNQVQAIFFTGNLVAGEERSDSENPKPIDDQQLLEQLQQFTKLYEGIFSTDVPFYPALGDREILIKNSAKTFIDHFKLKGAVILGDELLYTVSIGDAFFAVIATDEIKDGTKRSGPSYSFTMLQWLDKALKDGSKSHKYLFVVGYEPAFPSTSTFSKANQPQRDAFWRILVANKVLAYFSSKEHFFDRSYRLGVWQVITGGGGSPAGSDGEKQPFYHSLLLTIPGKDSKTMKAPAMQVIDNQGHIIEEFSFDPENQPLYQMRIS